jgi:uncharacterized membrane protein
MNPRIAQKRRLKSTQHNEGHRHEEHTTSRAGQQEINVGEAERQVSMIGGTVLATYGLLRGSLSGLALAAIGGALIWRGHTGHCQMYDMLGHSTADNAAEHGDEKTERGHESGRQTLDESHAAG